MQKSTSQATVTVSRFNFNKLQAVACIASSAACSIGLIYWAIKALS
ncbi:hypothetical protein [Noviherbaspirillum autotrophicum]|nr:hypothetical protein [Noviherbaspirillum autotrophicum]